MINAELFYSEEKGLYYFVGPPFCTKCGKNLKSVLKTPGFLLWDYWKAHFRAVVYCVRCKDELEKAGGKYQEIKQIIFIGASELPKDSLMITPDRPVLSNARNVSVFDVAVHNQEGEEVIDRSIAAHDPNFMIDSSAKNPLMIEADIREKDRALSLNDAERFFDDIMKAEPVLPHDDKKLLEEAKE